MFATLQNDDLRALRQTTRSGRRRCAAGNTPNDDDLAHLLLLQEYRSLTLAITNLRYNHNIACSLGTGMLKDCSANYSPLIFGNFQHPLSRCPPRALRAPACCG